LELPPRTKDINDDEMEDEKTFDIFAPKQILIFQFCFKKKLENGTSRFFVIISACQPLWKISNHHQTPVHQPAKPGVRQSGEERRRQQSWACHPQQAKIIERSLRSPHERPLGKKACLEMILFHFM
jgi:hypothetical protein